MEEISLTPGADLPARPANRRNIQIVRLINRLAYERILPAGLWFLLARAQTLRLIAFIQDEDWLLSARYAANLTFTLLIVALFILRHPVKGARARPVEALVAAAGTLLPVLSVLLPIRDSSPVVLLIGNLLVLAGLAWSILSLALLGRCFGLFPEARGLVTRGPYRIVRHPLYLGEIVAVIGLLLPAASPLGLALGLAFAGLQLWRSINEEQALIRIFPEYRAYMGTTYRIIPFIW
jgi:protein-S-isoprenylcysteine O-methyltransferase Ste14